MTDRFRLQGSLVRKVIRMGLGEIRKEIDEVDNGLKELFKKRMEISERIIEDKMQSGAAIYNPEREQEILDERSADVDESIKNEYKIFVKKTISLGRKHQYEIKCSADPKAIFEFVETHSFIKNLEAMNDANRIKVTFVCDDGAGSLANVLSIISNYGISVNDIESKRVENDVYKMHIVLKAPIKDNNTLACLYQLIVETDNFKILDVYTYEK